MARQYAHRGGVRARARVTYLLSYYGDPSSGLEHRLFQRQREHVQRVSFTQGDGVRDPIRTRGPERGGDSLLEWA